MSRESRELQALEDAEAARKMSRALLQKRKKQIKPLIFCLLGFCLYFAAFKIVGIAVFLTAIVFAVKPEKLKCPKCSGPIQIDEEGEIPRICPGCYVRLKD